MATLPATAIGILAHFCQPGMASAWRSEQRERSFYNAGFAHGFDTGYDLVAVLPGTWRIEPHWGEWPYYIGWRHDRDLAVLIYCEGDLSVEIAEDRAAYLELLRRTNAELAMSTEDEQAFLDRLASWLAREAH
jgi:hypothetical protein